MLQNLELILSICASVAVVAAAILAGLAYKVYYDQTKIMASNRLMDLDHVIVGHQMTTPALLSNCNYPNEKLVSTDDVIGYAKNAIVELIRQFIATDLSLSEDERTSKIDQIDIELLGINCNSARHLYCSLWNYNEKRDINCYIYLDYLRQASLDCGNVLYLSIEAYQWMRSGHITKEDYSFWVSYLYDYGFSPIFYVVLYEYYVLGYSDINFLKEIKKLLYSNCKDMSMRRMVECFIPEISQDDLEINHRIAREKDPCAS